MLGAASPMNNRLVAVCPRLSRIFIYSMCTYECPSDRHMLWNFWIRLNCVAKRILLVLVLCWFFWSKASILHRSVVKCNTFLRPELSTIDLFSTSLISASWGVGRSRKNPTNCRSCCVLGRKFKPLCKHLQRPILKCTFLDRRQKNVCTY